MSSGRIIDTLLPTLAAAKDVPTIAEASPPTSYWVLWVIVALIIILLIVYTLRGHKKHGYEGLAFAGIVSALALAAFAIMMSEAVSEYAKHHESPVISLGRFLILVIAATLLVYYAVKGRHEH